EGFHEDPHGNILIEERSALHIVKPDGTVVRLDSLGGRQISDCVASATSAGGNFLAQVGASIIEFSTAGVLRKMPLNIQLQYRQPFYIAMNRTLVAWRDSTNMYRIRAVSNGRLVTKYFDPNHSGHICFSTVGDSLVYWNGSSGSVECNYFTGQTRQFLPGIRVSKAFRDGFGNLWFTSIGKGLFRLNSNDTRLLRLSGEKGQPANVLALTSLGNQLWVGDDQERIFRLSLPDMTSAGGHLFYKFANNRILYLGLAGKDKILAGSDEGLLEGTREPRFLRTISTGVKSASRIDENT